MLEVHNGGNPIPPEAMPHLFDPFRARLLGRHGGLGLGLYIVEQVVKGHGGHIEVASTAEEGPSSAWCCPAWQAHPSAACGVAAGANG